MNKKQTKSSTSNEYSRRIKKAINFINNNLDQSINLEKAASASHFSSYHFHRIFHALVGETVNDYISRKRMEKAAYRLLNKTDLSITDIAEMGGFSSGANFSKAFKLYFGVSPSDLRYPGNVSNSKIGKIYRKYGKAFNPQDLYSQFVTNIVVFEKNKLEELLMQIKVKEMQEKSVAYLTSPKGYVLDSVFATWDKVISWANAQGINEQLQERFAICHDNPAITPEDKCRYDAAMVIEPDVKVTAPYTRSVIPAGKYAVAYYKDSGEKVNNFMTELCSNWFPTSGYEPDDYPPIFNYLNDARKDGYVEMNIYIKIKELETS